MQALDFDAAPPGTLAPAMARYMAMFDLVRDGAVNPVPAESATDTAERTRHLKAAGLYFDATLVGACAVPDAARCRRRSQPARGGAGRGARTKPAAELCRRAGHDPGRRAGFGAPRARPGRRTTRMRW
jgi:hypothetical protein